MSSLINDDAVRRLSSADKTLERNQASAVVQSVVWAAALDGLQRNKQSEREELSEHILKRGIQSSTFLSKRKSRFLNLFSVF